MPNLDENSTWENPIKPSRFVHAARLEAVLLGAVTLASLLFTWLYFIGVYKASGRPPRAVTHPVAAIKGFVEAEDMPVVGRSPSTLIFFKQPTDQFTDGHWSNNTQVLAYQAKVGDWVALGMPVQEAGRYLVSVYLTKAIDYGTVQIDINEKTVRKMDLFSETGKILSTGRVELGTFSLAPDKNLIRFKSVGHNPKNVSAYDQFGVDGISLERQ